MQIRDATLRDLPPIVAIYNSTIASRMVTADLEPISVEDRKDWFERHSTARHPLWVVEEAGTVVGWFSYSSFYGRPAYDGTCEASLYLAPEHRGQGLGGQLLQRGIDHAPAIGISTLLGFIFGHNLPSLKLFEKHGFQRWGYLPRVARLDGVERDLAILGRRV